MWILNTKICEWDGILAHLIRTMNFFKSVIYKQDGRDIARNGYEELNYVFGTLPGCD
jgi:hypothetical protein